MFAKRTKKVIAIISLALLMFVVACGDNSYENDVRSGFDKWSSGDYDSMTDGERKAVDDFLEWSNEN